MKALPGESDTVERTVAGERLLGTTVRVRGIHLGHPVDLLLDPRQARVLGLDVLCGDQRHRFLPFATATLVEGELRVPSALVLVDEEDAAFYRERTVRLSALRGLPVERGELRLGRLHDLVLGADGRIAALVVDADGARREVRCPEGLQVGGGILRC